MKYFGLRHSAGSAVVLAVGCHSLWASLYFPFTEIPVRSGDSTDKAQAFHEFACPPSFWFVIPPPFPSRHYSIVFHLNLHVTGHITCWLMWYHGFNTMILYYFLTQPCHTLASPLPWWNRLFLTIWLLYDLLYMATDRQFVWQALRKWKRLHSSILSSKQLIQRA
jgi:hypothetical protein